MNLFPNLLVFLAQTTSEGVPQTPNPLFQFMPLIFIGVIFYFLLIRPQQKQRKEHAALIGSLKTGDKVVTNAGIYGLISNVKETTLSLKVADNVKIEIDKSAVLRRVESGGEA